MKQLFIVQEKAYATATAKATDLTTVPEGTIALFSLVDGTLITAAPTSNFSIVVGRGEDKMPLVFPEVDYKSLTVQKAKYKAGVKFTGKITVPTPEIGKDYTVIVVKKGMQFNVRSNWTFTTRALTTTAADVAKQITNQINGNTVNLGVKATYTGGAITVTAINFGDDYELIGADMLGNVVPTDVTHGQKAELDKVDIQDLASRCAAGKGFNDTYRDGDSIYPGYPEVVSSDKYVLYTLRFAVPRVASKQRDEVVYQLVHIAVPQDAGAVGTLDSIFGIVEASTASTSGTNE